MFKTEAAGGLEIGSGNCGIDGGSTFIGTGSGAIEKDNGWCEGWGGDIRGDETIIKPEF